MQNETKLQKDIRHALEAEVGGFWWKVHGGMFQITGNPDLCGCVCGLYIGIEVKDGNNEASDVQLERVRQIKEAGGLAFVTWTVDRAVKKVKEHVKNFTVQAPEKSRKIIRKSKADRIIHGSGDWKDNHRFRMHRSKKGKTKKKT